jgi:hypothetical protein
LDLSQNAWVPGNEYCRTHLATLEKVLGVRVQVLGMVGGFMPTFTSIADSGDEKRFGGLKLCLKSFCFSAILLSWVASF